MNIIIVSKLVVVVLDTAGKVLLRQLQLRSRVCCTMHAAV